MYFDNYGILDWLEPSKFYAEHWTYIKTVRGGDGEEYDIVLNGERKELRFTTI